MTGEHSRRFIAKYTLLCRNLEGEVMTEDVIQTICLGSQINEPITVVSLFLSGVDEERKETELLCGNI